MTDEVVDDTSGHIEIEDGTALYAGKFKTIDDLEKAYKEGFSVHLKNKELQTKINEYTAIPENYSLPDDITLRDRTLNDIKSMAKSAGLTQEQFKRVVTKANADMQQNISSLDARIKEVGEDKVNVVKGYIDNKFSSFDEEFRQKALNNLIKDNSRLEKVMEDREKELNSKVPGIDQTASRNHMSENDMKREKYEAALKCKLDPRDKTAKAKYINLCRDIGHARSEKN